MNYLTVERKRFVARWKCKHKTIVVRKVTKYSSFAKPEYYIACLYCGRIHRLKNRGPIRHRLAIITERKIFVSLESRIES